MIWWTCRPLTWRSRRRVRPGARTRSARARRGRTRCTARTGVVCMPAVRARGTLHRAWRAGAGFNRCITACFSVPRTTAGFLPPEGWFWEGVASGRGSPHAACVLHPGPGAYMCISSITSNSNYQRRSAKLLRIPPASTLELVSSISSSDSPSSTASSRILRGLLPRVRLVHQVHQFPDKHGLVEETGDHPRQHV